MFYSSKVMNKLPPTPYAGYGTSFSEFHVIFWGEGPIDKTPYEESWKITIFWFQINAIHGILMKCMRFVLVFMGRQM